MNLAALLVAVLAFQDKPITHDEARELGRRIEKSMGDKDPKVMSDLMDCAVLTERTAKGLFLDEEGTTMVRAACGEAGGAMARRILEQGTSSGTSKYRFLRVKAGPEGPRPLFRLVTPTGVTYHELILVRSAGALRIGDIYIHTVAENITETLRKALLPALVAHTTKDQEKLDETLEVLKIFGKLAECSREGRWPDLLKLYDANAARLSKMKPAQLMRIQAASQGEEAAYLKILEEVEKAWPEESFTDLLRVDAFLLRKQYDKSLASVDRLDKLLGGDPYLHVLRCGVTSASGDLAKAKEWSARAVKEEPGHDAAWWAHVEVCLVLKDHAEVARSLTHLERELAADIAPDLTGVELFADFAASDEGRAWQAGRKKP